jgi:hypothetical protein
MINDDTDDLTDEIADSTGQRPEYELTDDSHAGQRPEWELVEHSPPPPDEKVIDLEEARRHGQQRSWLLCTFIGVLVLVIASDIALSTVLPAQTWLQVKPEMDYLRNSMFTILLIIIGYYFGEKKNCLPPSWAW